MTLLSEPLPLVEIAIINLLSRSFFEAMLDSFDHLIDTATIIDSRQRLRNAIGIFLASPRTLSALIEKIPLPVAC
eukprot:CAMPEP_0169242390 /NCGR_PEP_ID=MMETSP1016-20121227/32515_1 /TAXON_ID=342587 /ORGANISM="Karlodinium micrum, Strain CCMP2283" /LENGTH=74 /DNA_ID=CAMNT_0009322579 /DNA_START=794 /DNA_END=1018 /DNA_ORIENTATION=-